MNGGVVFDSNVLIYTLARNDPRQSVARGLLAVGGGTVSVQTLNEFANVARRKLHLSWPEAAKALRAIRALCRPPLPLTLATQEAALGITDRLGYGFYDGLIIASALEADCAVLFSEDMQGGQVIEGRLTIRDPFKA